MSACQVFAVFRNLIGDFFVCAFFTTWNIEREKTIEIPLKVTLTKF